MTTTFATLPGDILTAVASYVDGPQIVVAVAASMPPISLLSRTASASRKRNSRRLAASYAAGRLFKRCGWRRDML